MRNDFCLFILSHRRADNVLTYQTIQKTSYTGKLFIVVDDQDQQLDQYRNNFKDKLLTFSKMEVSKTTDCGDNFNDYRTPLYARNACFDLARKVGCKYFMVLDDDYSVFFHMIDKNMQFGHWKIKTTMEESLEALIDYYESCPIITSIAMAQGGDFIGGKTSIFHETGKAIGMRRKAMNSFLCSVDRPFKYVARLNDDVTTYVTLGSRGQLFLTVLALALNQKITQKQSGGLTEAYLDSGTYIKSFYSVMYMPSCVQIGDLGNYQIEGSPDFRIHHKIIWPRAVPKILRECHRKP